MARDKLGSPDSRTNQRRIGAGSFFNFYGCFVALIQGLLPRSEERLYRNVTELGLRWYSNYRL